jgi:ribosome-associated toxin RatA of RatAB toxin-antitoxin module
MAEHHAAVTVNAPVHQVYALFTHFNDFPKFMSFVKEVTYYDNQNSHWVADVVGRHEWDAVNENWVEDRQIGWHSTRGLENVGKVTFEPIGPTQTRVDTFIAYNPPGGILGSVGESLGAGKRFEDALQRDLDNFAHMVEQAPPGSLDPNASNYLFHSESAAATGTTTEHQDQTMGGPSARTETPTPPATEERPILDRDIIAEEGNTTGTPQSPMPPTYPSER